MESVWGVDHGEVSKIFNARWGKVTGHAVSAVRKPKAFASHPLTSMGGQAGKESRARGVGLVRAQKKDAMARTMGLHERPKQKNFWDDDTPKPPKPNW